MDKWGGDKWWYPPDYQFGVGAPYLGTLTALPEQGDKPKPGYVKGHRFGFQMFAGRMYPSCSRHGAMNRVSADADWWRCVEDGCNIGCEWDRREMPE